MSAASKAAYDADMQQNALQAQPQPSLARPQHAPALQPGDAVAPAMSASAGPSKRKPGRPRKHDQNLAMPLAINPAPHPTVGVPSGLVSPQAPPPSHVPPPPPPSANAMQQVRRSDQAPRQVVTGGVTGYYPQVITVQVGEDVTMKVMSYCGIGWAVCILYASGVVSNVALRHEASSTLTFLYEGYFQILSLSGSYLLSETDGLSSRKGRLGISLASPNGLLLGGEVAGPLTAASLVQVVIGRFPVTSGIPGGSGSTPRGAMS